MSARSQPLDVPGLSPARRFAPSPYLALLKLRIVALLVFVSLVAAVLAAGVTPAFEKLLLLALAGALSSAGAAALNQFLERDLDAAMVRTSARPLPSGRVSPAAALLLGIALVVAALFPAIALGPGTTLFVLAGLFCYVFVYTLWLKRLSYWNVPIGGLAGSCAVLAGWTATGDRLLSPAPLLLASLLLLWNQCHFWAFAIALQSDYRRARVPMLPVVVGVGFASRAVLANTAAVVIASLAMYVAVPLGTIYLVGALTGGTILLGHNLRLALRPEPGVGWASFKLSGVYLVLLYAGIALDTIV